MSQLEAQKLWLEAEQRKLDAQKPLIETDKKDLSPGRPVTFLDEMRAFVNGQNEKPGRRFKVENVVDGDTMDLAGFGRVRLAGIDTPETVHPTKGVQPGGPEASNFTKKMANGKWVTVKLQRKDTEDKYGRALTVLEDDEGNIFNTEIVTAGHAKQTAGVPTGSAITTPEVGRLWREATEAAKTGIKRGILYPVSTLFAEDYRYLQREGDIHRRNLLQEMDSRGIVDGSVRDTVAMAPEVVGELIGGLPANIATYTLASGVTGVSKATSIAGKVVRSMGAAGLSSASLSAAAEIDNGESRFAHMAKDFAIGGLFEVVGMPLMRKAWTAEIGEKVAKDATARIAKDLGVEPEIVATHIDALRAGGVGADIRVVERLEAELAKNPAAAASPVGQIVSKAKSDWHHNVLPDEVSINPELAKANPNFGVRGMISIKHPQTGNVEVVPFHFTSERPNSPPGEGGSTYFESETLKLRNEISVKKQQGFEVKMTHAETHDSRAWNRFANLMFGSKHPKPIFSKVAPGTFAAQNRRAAAGESVRDDLTGKVVTAVGDDAGDVLKGVEVTSALRNASDDDLMEAATHSDKDIASVAEAELASRDTKTKKTRSRVTKKMKAELSALGVSEEEIAGMKLSEVKKRLTSQAKPGADVTLPKGGRVQGPLFKWDESSGNRSTNEMGVGGYQRRTSENTLVRLLTDAKKENSLRDVERRLSQGDLSPQAEIIMRRRLDSRDRRTRMQELRDKASAYRATRTTVTEGSPDEPVKMFRVKDDSGTRFYRDAEDVADLPQNTVTEIEMTRGQAAKYSSGRSAEEMEAERLALSRPVDADDVLGGPSHNPWQMKVRTETGQVETRTLAQVTPLETVLQRGAKPAIGLKPHSTGQVRRGVVDLESGKLELEDFDNPSLTWDSPEMKMILDDDVRVGHAPRLFMHADGVTFSIPNTQQYDPLRGNWEMDSLRKVEGYDAKVMDVGPIDTLAAYQRPQRVYTTTGVPDLSYRQEDSITRRFGLIQREKRMANKDTGRLITNIVSGGQVTAGGEVKGRLLTRRSTTETRFKDSSGEWRSKKTKLGGQYEAFASEGDTVELSGRFAAGFSSPKASDYEPGPFHVDTVPRTLDQVPNELEPGMVTERPASFAISKEGVQNPLELVKAKRMAEVMIKEGADPSTKVRITVSGGQWDDVDAPFEWTLEELAAQRFKPVNWRSMTAVAQSRGYQAIPDGFAVILKSPGRSTTFHSGEEALAYLTSIPRMRKYSPVLEKKLLEDWAAAGAERSTHFHVDASRYRSVGLQESSITEVVGGRSAATIIGARDEEALKKAVLGLATEQKTGGRYEVLNLTVADTMVQPTGQKQLSLKEQAMMSGKEKVKQPEMADRRPGVIYPEKPPVRSIAPEREIPVETTSRGRIVHSKETLDKMKAEKAALQAEAPPAKPDVPQYQDPERFLVYEENSVKAKILQHAATLKKMGIDVTQPTPVILRQLARYGKGSGLNFLFGQRDAADQLMYAQLRQWNKSSLFNMGGKQNDVHGGFMVFGPEVRKKIGAELMASPPPTGLDPTLQGRLRGAPQGPEMIPGRGGKMIPGKLAEPFGAGGGAGNWTDDVPDDLEGVGKLLAPIGGGSGDERMPIVDLTPDAFEKVGQLKQEIENIRGYRFLDIFRVPMQLFKEYQTATGIPFYRWWEALDHGRTQVTRFTNPALSAIHGLTRGIKSAERQHVGQLFEMRYADPTHYARTKGDYSEVVQRGEELLNSTMRKFLEDMGLDADKELAELPYFRKRNVELKEMRPYQSGRPPSPITRKSNAFMDDLPMDEREYDFSITMKRYAKAIAHEKFLAPQWDEINKTMAQLQTTVSDPATEKFIQMFNRHRAELVHAQDDLGYGMAIGIQNVGKMLKLDLNLEDAQDIISTFAGANYFANLAFNIGVTGRNYLQVLQTVYPVMGAKATTHGIKMALKWRKDPELRKTMEQLDIVNMDTMLEGLSNIQQAVLESDRLHSVAKPLGKVVDVMNKGVAMYQAADDFNKVASYHAQYYHAYEAAQKYLKNTADPDAWGKFVHESKLNMRDIQMKHPVTGETIEGPLMTRVKEALAKGAPKSAAHQMALDFAKESQFMYSRGNAPAVMQSTIGRLAMQYGTWPAWYVEWVGNNMAFRRGTGPENFKNMARWAGVNSALFFGMSEVFGVDFARWTFFAPLSYQGGPLAQIAQQGAAAFGAATSGDDDPVARIQAERLKGAWKQLVPFPTVAARSTIGGVEKVMDGEYAEGVKQFLGLPSTDKRQR